LNSDLVLTEFTLIPNVIMSSIPSSAPQLKAVEVRYEHSPSLPQLLEQLDLSLLISTYQAGQVVSLGVHHGALQVRFAHFEQAMGLTRTPTGIAIGSHHAIWNLPAHRDIAPQIRPTEEHDIAFLARSCHWSGPLMVHDLAFCHHRLWVVNTLFNCLATIEGPWSFIPQWKPPFISTLTPGDRCHLNGLAIHEDGSTPAYVTTLGETDQENGWREHKTNGGCLIDVANNAILLRGLSMPHSPRLYRGDLYFLDSGYGHLNRYNPLHHTSEVIARLPGFTRGLECWGDHAFVGLSRIRETAIFGGLPLQSQYEHLRCGVGIINLMTQEWVGSFWFNNGVEEVFAITGLPGYRNPILMGPDTGLDANQTIWMVPPSPPS
jgi:uncharacterized protein (TIGR03032 family)